MNVNDDLIGKTISGVIATAGRGNSEKTLWMLQFTDGSHVEFVSPHARRALNRVPSGLHGMRKSAENDPQLVLNVA
jgi:hypothetical protein